METSTQVTQQQPKGLKEILGQDNIKQRFNELLGKKAPGFISSLMQVTQSSNLLQNANPQTVLAAAVTAASLDLPINPNLGFAWIVPYKGQAQFQMGWKGYVQLAMRTAQYEKINAVEVHENQFRSFNALTEELDADFSVEGSGKVVGYAAYFKTINGFSKTVYWSRQKVEMHAKKYSQSYKRGQGVWADGEDGFTAMAKKTVLKLMLSQWGIMSIELQTALPADQAVLTEDGQPYQYPDNLIDIDANNEAEETGRAIGFISKATTLEELEMAVDGVVMNDEITAAHSAKYDELEKTGKK